MADEVELQGCEHCGNKRDIEKMLLMSDAWFCMDCYDEWKKEFDACDHQWEPQVSEFGEPGRYCSKCCGFQCLEDVQS